MLNVRAGRATWRNCRRETWGYRIRTTWLSMRMGVIAGPEPTWSP